MVLKIAIVSAEAELLVEASVLWTKALPICNAHSTTPFNFKCVLKSIKITEC